MLLCLSRKETGPGDQTVRSARSRMGIAPAWTFQDREHSSLSRDRGDDAIKIAEKIDI
jgi:hypothetical protein